MGAETTPSLSSASCPRGLMEGVQSVALKSKGSNDPTQSPRDDKNAPETPRLEVEGEPRSREVLVPEEAPAELETQASPKPRPVLRAGVLPGKMNHNGYVPMGHIEKVDCPLFEGLHLVALYNTSLAYRILRDNYEGPGETPVEKEARRVLLICPGFEGWAFQDPLSGEAIPVPDPNDWESYRPIVAANGLLTVIYPWLLGEGLTTALGQAAGN